MNILGIGGHVGHDPAACLVRDGSLVAMAEEERFVRVKRAPGLAPVNAALYCLREAGLTVNDIDLIASSDDPNIPNASTLIRTAMNRFRRSEVFRDIQFPPIVSVNHHLSHAAASFFSSGFDDAAIVTVDGQGENVSTTIAHGRGRHIEVLRSFDVSQSLGYFYSAVTHYVGLGPNSAGKLMGLAPYGEPKFDISALQLTDEGYHLNIHVPSIISSDELPTYIRAYWLRFLRSQFGSMNRASFNITSRESRISRQLTLNQHYKDIAASVQKAVENTLLHLVKTALRLTGARKVVLGGGVALNCSANGVIRQSGIVDDIYIFPAAHDAGCALGAALEVAARHGEPACPEIKHAYWGPSYSDSDVTDVMRRSGLAYSEHVDVIEKTAELLTRGKVVGWLQGRMEVGPRALGHRSILANATDHEALLRVNQIKGREIWRPLAPSILQEEMSILLEHPFRSPFMLQAIQIQPNSRDLIPAVTHVDGSTRPQTVEYDACRIYYDLLKCMKNKIGIGVVLNTSFNRADEPIVCTPVDAIRTFVSTDLDALVIGQHIVLKPSVH